MMLNLDNIPDSVTQDYTGQQKLIIKNAEAITCSTGSKAIQFTFGIDGSQTEIRYENCVLYDKDGGEIKLGLVKLKKIMKAAGVNLTGNFTPKIACATLKNKTLLADVVKNDKGYWALSSNFDSYLPVETAKSTENITNTIKEHEEADTIKPFSQENISIDEGWN